MSQMDKMERFRYDGAEWILRYAEEHGIEAARAEMNKRRAVGAPIYINETEVKKFGERLKKNMSKSYLCMACFVLHNEYDFGKARIERFMKRFDEICECMWKDYLNWDDVQEDMLKEIGVTFEIEEDCKK